MKRILVIATAYPTESNPAMMMFVHTRNLFYSKAGMDVTVLSYSSPEDYIFQGINVISYQTFKQNPHEYTTLVAHAPNIRFHYKFLKKYQKYFQRIVFFFHGHEVLKINEVYSKPYSFVKKDSIMVRMAQDAYDEFKLLVWRKYLPKILYKSHLVFVSNWMYEEFLKWVKIPKELLLGRTSITYNGVGEIFEKETYNKEIPKEFDFITIRPNLDGSKYAVDIVRKIALENPDMKFLVIGKGEFFSHYTAPENMTRIEEILTHQEIVEYLNKAKYALMPTRTDAQGLMACEMATFGIPLITSDIPVCHEIFNWFSSVAYIDNDMVTKNDLSNILHILTTNNPITKTSAYFSKNTMQREVELLRNI